MAANYNFCIDEPNFTKNFSLKIETSVTTLVIRIATTMINIKLTSYTKIHLLVGLPTLFYKKKRVSGKLG